MQPEYHCIQLSLFLDKCAKKFSFNCSSTCKKISWLSPRLHGKNGFGSTQVFLEAAPRIRIAILVHCVSAFTSCWTSICGTAQFSFCSWLFGSSPLCALKTVLYYSFFSIKDDVTLHASFNVTSAELCKTCIYYHLKVTSFNICFLLFFHSDLPKFPVPTLEEKLYTSTLHYN